MRLFVAIAFTSTLFIAGPAAAHFGRSLQADSPLQFVQDKGKKKKQKKSTKQSVPKDAPAQRDRPIQSY